jgi:cytoplasmic iron level regulating protein YaaA (DUF328/UPF0246 family)
MKIVISPAKSLNFEKNYLPSYTEPLFFKESRQIQKSIKKGIAKIFVGTDAYFRN